MFRPAAFAHEKILNSELMAPHGNYISTLMVDIDFPKLEPIEFLNWKPSAKASELAAGNSAAVDLQHFIGFRSTLVAA